jgi:hypothetical protein
VSIQEGKERVAKVDAGTVVADVAWIKGAPPARFAFGAGEVEVLGTKLMLTASNNRANVEVARGKVRVRPTSGKWMDVRAGEEATMEPGRETVVASSASVAESMEWSDRSPEELDAPVLRGVGELRARKPGQTTEKDRAVRLSKHSVKVRVVDVVARTEVDETFTNDTDEELEGIYRFPLPPGAQIERLALEVDGKLMEGAFVDRDKGAAIWRGVIQNAAPKTPKPKEEIIWVAGSMARSRAARMATWWSVRAQNFPDSAQRFTSRRARVHADCGAISGHPTLHVSVGARSEWYDEDRCVRPGSASARTRQIVWDPNSWVRTRFGDWRRYGGSENVSGDKLRSSR